MVRWEKVLRLFSSGLLSQKIGDPGGKWKRKKQPIFWGGPGNLVTTYRCPENVWGKPSRRRMRTSKQSWKIWANLWWKFWSLFCCFGSTYCTQVFQSSIGFFQQHHTFKLLLMAEILHQLRLVVYPIIYRVLAPSQGVSRISEPSTVPQLLSTVTLL